MNKAPPSLLLETTSDYLGAGRKELVKAKVEPVWESGVEKTAEHYRAAFDYFQKGLLIANTAAEARRCLLYIEDIRRECKYLRSKTPIEKLQELEGRYFSSGYYPLAIALSFEIMANENSAEKKPFFWENTKRSFKVVIEDVGEPKKGSDVFSKEDLEEFNKKLAKDLANSAKKFYYLELFKFIDSKHRYYLNEKNWHEKSKWYGYLKKFVRFCTASKDKVLMASKKDYEKEIARKVDSLFAVEILVIEKDLHSLLKGFSYLKNELLFTDAVSKLAENISHMLEIASKIDKNRCESLAQLLVRNVLNDRTIEVREQVVFKLLPYWSYRVKLGSVDSLISEMRRRRALKIGGELYQAKAYLAAFCAFEDCIKLSTTTEQVHVVLSYIRKIRKEYGYVIVKMPPKKLIDWGIKSMEEHRYDDAIMLFVDAMHNEGDEQKKQTLWDKILCCFGFKLNNQGEGRYYRSLYSELYAVVFLYTLNRKWRLESAWFIRWANFINYCKENGSEQLVLSCLEKTKGKIDVRMRGDVSRVEFSFYMKYHTLLVKDSTDFCGKIVYLVQFRDKLGGELHSHLCSLVKECLMVKTDEFKSEVYHSLGMYAKNHGYMLQAEELLQLGAGFKENYLDEAFCHCELAIFHANRDEKELAKKHYQEGLRSLYGYGMGYKKKQFHADATVIFEKFTGYYEKCIYNDVKNKFRAQHKTAKQYLSGFGSKPNLFRNTVCSNTEVNIAGLIRELNVFTPTSRNLRHLLRTTVWRKFENEIRQGCKSSPRKMWDDHMFFLIQFAQQGVRKALHCILSVDKGGFNSLVKHWSSALFSAEPNKLKLEKIDYMRVGTAIKQALAKAEVTDLQDSGKEEIKLLKRSVQKFLQKEFLKKGPCSECRKVLEDGLGIKELESRGIGPTNI